MKIKEITDEGSHYLIETDQILTLHEKTEPDAMTVFSRSHNMITALCELIIQEGKLL